MSTAQSSISIPATADPEARDHVRAVVTAAGTSFFWAMRFLPRDKRRAMYAVYAFCREVDDIADGPGSPKHKQEALTRWREEVSRLFAGNPRYPTARALLPAIELFGLRQIDFEAVIDGMAMDAQEPIRLPTMDALLLYCDRVACAVGRLCVHIFGEPGGDGMATAKHLGLALQLTNILRDIEEDAARNRIYLPADLLGKHGVATTSAAEMCRNPRLREVCSELALLAEEHFRQARAAIGRCSRRNMRPAIIMMEVYHRKLMRMQATGFANAGRRSAPGSVAGLWGKVEKLAIALRYGLF